MTASRPERRRAKRELQKLQHQLEREFRLGEIIHMPIAAIKTYDRPLRKGSDRQLTGLKASLSNFGFVIPLPIDAENVLIGGEQLLRAAKELGRDDVPIVRIDHLSPEKVRLLRIALNRLAEQSSWHDENLVIEMKELLSLDLAISIEVSGFSMAEIDARVDCPAEEVSDADLVPAIQEVAATSLGDVWLLGRHRLACGSSLEGATFQLLMQGELARMVFTDQPYDVKIAGNVSGLGKHKHREFVQGSGELGREGFTAFQITSVGLIAAHCLDGAILFLCMDHRHMREIMAGIDAAGLTHMNLAVWAKTNGGMGSLYRSQHELVFVAKKGSAPHRNNVQLGKFGRHRTNVWTYAGVNVFGAERDAQLAMHPTCKPVAMVADAIRDVSNRGEIVLDPFLGSGTTLIACEKTGRVCYGIDLDPLYVDVAVRRWQELTGLEAVLEASGETFAEVAARRAAVTDLLGDLSARRRQRAA